MLYYLSQSSQHPSEALFSHFAYEGPEVQEVVIEWAQDHAADKRWDLD